VFSAELAETHGLVVGFGWGEVLVLGDASERHLLVAVVHDGCALEVTVDDELFEVERAIAEPTEVIVEERVERAAPNHMVVLRRRRRVEPSTQGDLNAGVIQNRLDDRRVSIGRDGLVGMIEVRVLVVEPKRQPFQNRSRQRSGRHAPLFAGVSLEEEFVEPAADHGQRLLFEVLGLVPQLERLGAGDELLGLGRRQRRAIDLIDRVQVDGKTEHRAFNRRLDLVVVLDHVAEAIDVVPHSLVVGVKDMRAITMDEHAGLVAFRMAVAPDMITSVEYMALVARFGQFAGDYRSGETRARDTYRCHVSRVTTLRTRREVGWPVVENDHELAARLATLAGGLLIAVRAELSEAEVAVRKNEGDRRAHNLLMHELQAARPADAILSEEGKDDAARLSADRTWIIDPLDGTREFGEIPRTDWAVHVALVQNGQPTAGAVALPALQTTLATGDGLVMPESTGAAPRVIASRSRPGPAAEAVAEALGGEMIFMGSAGAKAMAVVCGEADIYAHTGGQYEWDSCAPVAVALAAGMHASRIDGSQLVYNNPDPYLPDLLICRPEFAQASIAAVQAAGVS